MTLDDMIGSMDGEQRMRQGREDRKSVDSRKGLDLGKLLRRSLATGAALGTIILGYSEAQAQTNNAGLDRSTRNTPTDVRPEAEAAKYSARVPQPGGRDIEIASGEFKSFPIPHASKDQPPAQVPENSSPNPYDVLNIPEGVTAQVLSVNPGINLRTEPSTQADIIDPSQFSGRDFIAYKDPTGDPTWWKAVASVSLDSKTFTAFTPPIYFTAVVPGATSIFGDLGPTPTPNDANPADTGIVLVDSSGSSGLTNADSGAPSADSAVSSRIEFSYAPENPQLTMQIHTDIPFASFDQQELMREARQIGPVLQTNYDLTVRLVDEKDMKDMEDVFYLDSDGEHELVGYGRPKQTIDGAVSKTTATLYITGYLLTDAAEGKTTPYYLQKAVGYGLLALISKTSGSLPGDYITQGIGETLYLKMNKQSPRFVTIPDPTSQTNG